MSRSSQDLMQTQRMGQGKMLLVGNRIPKDFFITSGSGQSDITVHAGSYHLALKDAGIERCNIVTYSSILPSVANEVEKPSNIVHGSVMETIMACSDSRKGQPATAGIIFGWLYDRNTGQKYGGLVCEYSQNGSEEEAERSLRASLDELYENGFSKNYEMKDIRLITKSFTPVKNFGTSLVALCFVNYLYPTFENG